jgi:hypothetical protein
VSLDRKAAMAGPLLLPRRRPGAGNGLIARCG